MHGKGFLRRRRYLSWVIFGLLLAGAATASVIRQSLARTTLTPVYTTVEQGDVMDTIEATGTVDAVTTVQVGAQVSGRIEKILVDFNSRVTKGQVLAHIEDAPFRAALKQAQADVQAGRAAIKAAEAGVESAAYGERIARANLARDQALARQAKIEYDRGQGLYDSQVLAAADRDIAQHNWQGAQAAAASSAALVAQAAANTRAAAAQLQQARTQLKTLEAALAQARTNFSYTTIKSPMDGTVIARNVDVGQTIASRLTAPDMFDIAQNLKHMYVYTKLDVRDVSRVHRGQRAMFTVDAFPGSRWEGAVAQVRISPITAMKGAAAPSQLPKQLQAAQTTIPGLQQSGSSNSTGATGTSATSGANSTTSANSSTTATTIGTGSQQAPAPSVSPSNVPAATSAPGLAQYDALIEFRNDGLTLLPGMTAYVTIPVSAAYGVVRIRKEALAASPSISLAEKSRLLGKYRIGPGRNVVWIRDGGVYRPVPVELGMTDYVFAEVKSGLQPGQQILAGYRPR